MELLSRLLQVWVNWVLHWPRLVLGIAVVSALASVALTVTKLEMMTDQLELISEDHPLITLSDRLDLFNSNSKRKFDIVIEASTPYRAVSFVNELSSRIANDRDHFQSIFYRVDPESFKPWQLLYLDKKELISIKEKVDSHASIIQKFTEGPELLSFLKLLNQEMASRMVSELFTDFLEEGEPKEDKEEPFDLTFLIATLEGRENAAWMPSSQHRKGGYPGRFNYNRRFWSPDDFPSQGHS
jgi:uncharacterized protein